MNVKYVFKNIHLNYVQKLLVQKMNVNIQFVNNVLKNILNQCQGKNLIVCLVKKNGKIHL